MNQAAPIIIEQSPQPAIATSVVQAPIVTGGSYVPPPAPYVVAASPAPIMTAAPQVMLEQVNTAPAVTYASPAPVAEVFTAAPAVYSQPAINPMPYSAPSVAYAATAPNVSYTPAPMMETIVAQAPQVIAGPPMVETFAAAPYQAQPQIIQSAPMVETITAAPYQPQVIQAAPSVSYVGSIGQEAFSAVPYMAPQVPITQPAQVSWTPAPVAETIPVTMMAPATQMPTTVLEPGMVPMTYAPQYAAAPTQPFIR